MSEFDDLQNDVDRAREATRAARREAARLKRQLAQLKRTQREQQRGSRSQTPETDSRGAGSPRWADPALEREIEQHRATLAHRPGRSRAVRPICRLHRSAPQPSAALGPHADPADAAAHRDRFKFTNAAALDGNELWVRVYPDDISVDAFEQTLSESEAHNARAYWADMWRAGGGEADQRGAWRVFVAGQGAGRAYWVVQNYPPLNAADQPAKAAACPRSFWRRHRPAARRTRASAVS